MVFRVSSELTHGQPWGHPWELSHSLHKKLKNGTPMGIVIFTSYKAQKWDTQSS
jgi:hypothetical protein